MTVKRRLKAAGCKVTAMLEDDEVGVVVIVGGIGAGKSFMLTAAMAALESSQCTVESLPGGELAAWRPRPVPPQGPHPRAATRLPVLLVDDLDSAAPQAVVRLTHLINIGALRVVATTRSDRASAVLAGLRVHRRCEVITLPPWDETRVGEHLGDALGGRVHPFTSSWLHRLSQGNPLALSDFVMQGRSDDHFLQTPQGWLWRGAPPVPVALRARYREVLSRLDDSGADLLAAICLHPDVTLRQAVTEFGAAAVEQLEAAGLLRLGERGPLALTAAEAISTQTDAIAGRLDAVRVRGSSQLLVQIVRDVMPTARRHRLSALWPNDTEPADVAPVLRQAAAEAAAGRVGAALRILATTKDATGEEAGFVHACHARLELLTGTPRGALASARRQQDVATAAGDQSQFASAALLSAGAELELGRAEVAGRWAAWAEVCDVPGPALRESAAAVRAVVEARLSVGGGCSTSRSEGRRLRSLDAGAGENFGAVTRVAAFDLDLIRVDRLLTLGQHAAAEEAATHLATRAEAAGSRPNVVLALQLAARARPSATTTQALARAASHCDYAVAELYVRLARALELCRDRELVALAAAFAERGMVWLAAETAARADATTPADRETVHRVLALLRAEQPTFPAWWRTGPHRELTAREREIVGHAGRGLSSGQIAKLLQLSQRTVDNHLHHSYRKLGVTGRRELAEAMEYRPAQLGPGRPHG